MKGDVLPGRNSKRPLEAAVQMALVAETCALRDFRDWRARGQQLSRPIDADDGLISVRWDSDAFAKRSHKIVRTQARNASQRVYRYVLRRVGIQPIFYSPDCRVLLSRVFESAAGHKVIRGQPRHNRQQQRFVLQQ